MPIASNVGRKGAASMGITVHMEPSPLLLVAQFNKLGADIRSFKEPLKRAVQQVLAPSIRHNFDVGGRPEWAPVFPTTQARKDKKRQGSKTLVATGKLRRRAGQLNLWTIRGQEGYAAIEQLPQDIWYGRIHQEGSGGIWTDRPWAVVQPQDIDDVENVFSHWLGERLHRAGFR